MRLEVTTATGDRLVYDDSLPGGFDAPTLKRLGGQHGAYEPIAEPGVGFLCDMFDVRCIAWMLAARADPDRPVDPEILRLADEWIASLDLGWNPEDDDPDAVY